MGAGCHLAGAGTPWASRNLCQLGRATIQLPESQAGKKGLAVLTEY